MLEKITAGIEFENIEKIITDDGNRLTICFKDGTSVEQTWKDRSRFESWTDEKRAEARRKTRERSNGECKEFKSFRQN